MKRRRADDDAKTHPHARALEPRSEGSADAIFRSFVQRASGVPEVPADTVTAPDQTPADGVPLHADDLLPDAAAEFPDHDHASFGEATDPRMPPRWAETVELLLDPRTDLDRATDVPAPFEPPEATARAELAPAEPSTVIVQPARMTPAEGVMLLTARKTASPSTPAPHDEDDDDDVRTVSVQSSRLIERVRAAGPARPDESAPAPPPAAVERPGSGRMRAALETPSEPIELRAPAKRPSNRPASQPAAPRTSEPRTTSEPWESVVRAPSETTQRREAMRLVPDVAQVSIAKPPTSERSEDGLIPSGVLDRKLGDMAVLLRYGHEAQVRRELDQLRTRYAQDLLLARRIAEFYVSNERPALALEQLFSLATGLFERRNVEGMKQTLEQVLVIDPRNERATRLLALLEQRPADPPAPGKKPR